MSNNPLKITDLSKKFGEKIVLDRVNFELKSNEIFGLIGLNGVGKTTLIKIILDLLNADSGEVKIFDTPSTSTSSREKLRYLPEKFQVSSMLKGMEFLKIFNDFDKTYKATKEELETEIYKLADLLALDKNALNLKVSKSWTYINFFR